MVPRCFNQGSYLVTWLPLENLDRDYLPAKLVEQPWEKLSANYPSAYLVKARLVREILIILARKNLKFFEYCPQNKISNAQVRSIV